MGDWAANTWARLAALPLKIERVSFEQPSLALPEFERIVTVITLHGGGHTGLGEDVVYDPEEHRREAATNPPFEPAGDWTLGDFCAQVAAVDLFPDGDPEQSAYRRYRRWAWESAALDLALRQSGVELAEVLGRAARPLRFVSSAKVGSPPSLEMIHALRDAAPGLEFKLDAGDDWDDDFLLALADAGGVASVDLKGHYVGTSVDVVIAPAQVERIGELLPGVTLEDVAPGASTELIAARWPERLAWDAPIHELADIEALPIEPQRLNIKPSRIGSIEELLKVYEYVDERKVESYAGGQFELSVGRGQIMLLASLMHPDGPNDCAPAVFHSFKPGDDVPGSPLPAPQPVTGFRWPGD